MHFWRRGRVTGFFLCVDRGSNCRTQCTPDNRTIATTDLIANCRTGSPTDATTNCRIQG